MMWSAVECRENVIISVGMTFSGLRCFDIRRSVDKFYRKIKAEKVFRMADKKISAGVQKAAQMFDNFTLVFLRKIYHDITAENDVEYAVKSKTVI